MASSNPFAQAIEAFIDNLREDEDPQSPFYQELLKVAAKLRCHDGAGEQSAISAKALQLYIENLDKEQTKHGKTRRVATKLQPLVTGLLQFTDAMDTMIQAGPAPAMLIYGSAKLVLRLVQGFADCFDKMVDAMHEIGTILDCYRIMSQTYDSSDAMRTILVNSYKNILTFWQKAAKLFTRNGVKTFFKGVVKPFDFEWKIFRGRLELDRREVTTIAQALEGSAARRREEQVNLRHERSRQQACERHLRSWISGFDDAAQIDVRMDLEPIQKARHAGTCEWIFKDSEYRQWLTSTNNENLWLHANPGTGKSVLCSTIIQQLQSHNKKVVYFFCSFQDPLKRKITYALKSLALQLLSLHDDVPTDVERIFQQEVRLGHMKLQNPVVIQSVLQALLKSLDRVHIVLDGLDECDNESKDRELTIQLLRVLFGTSTFGIVKWLWASRIEPDFQRLSSHAKARLIHIQNSQVESDIRTFVENSPEMANSSHKSVSEWVVASEGNFLWLTIMLRTLTGCDLTCPADVQEELSRFPKGLKQCYQQVLDRLSKRPKIQQELARKLFLLVTFAEQPLTLHETLDALSIDEHSGDISSDRRPWENLVKQLCCPLISLHPTSKNGRRDLTLRYFHKSTRDFFLQDPESLDITGGNKSFFAAPEQGQLSMSKLCMSYLSNDRYRDPKLLDPESDAFVDDHGFMRYAALFWHRHFSYAGYSDRLFELTRSFVRSTNFWSCVRVQALVAPYLFGRLVGESEGRFAMIKPDFVDASDRDYFATPLPDWLVDSVEGSYILRAYLAFIREWNPVLLRRPRASLQCHPEVLGSQDILSTEGVEYLNGCIASLKPVSTPAQESSILSKGLDVVRVLGTQTTKSGLRVFSIDRARDDLSSYTLKQWHVNFSDRSTSGTVETKQKRSWNVESSAGLPLLQLRSQKDIHEPVVWFFDVEKLALSVRRAGGETHNYIPPAEVRQPYADMSCNTSPGARTPRFISLRQHQNGHYLLVSALWRLDWQTTGSETDDDFDDSDESDSDVSDDDSNSDGSKLSKNSGKQQKFRKESYFGLVIAIEGVNEPIWSSWKSASESVCDLVIGHNSKRPLLVWPIDESLVQSTCFTGRVSRQVPIPALAAIAGSDTLLRDLHFSTCGTVLHCLTVTFREDPDTMETIYVATLEKFALECSETGLLGLTEPTPGLVPISISYTTRRTESPITILRSWTDDWVYLAINSLSSLCAVKILKLPLSGVGSSDSCATQTVSEAMCVPASFSTRSPIFSVSRNSTEEHLTFMLQSSAISHETDASLSTPSSLVAASSTEPAAIVDDSSPLILPPTLITYKVSSLDGWQAWDAERDGKEPSLGLESGMEDYLKGNYAAVDQTFQVPIRSGLNWRQAITVSCW